jgi:hypothetical protein
MPFNFFLSLFDHIFQLSLYIVMTLSNLNESELVLFPLVKSCLNFIS